MFEGEVMTNKKIINYSEFIISDPEIQGGAPTIKGTRITTSSVYYRLNGGETILDLVADYPYVSARTFERAFDFHMRLEELKKKNEELLLTPDDYDDDSDPPLL